MTAQPGRALVDAVAVMDRLRSPGGCPWDAEQTHSSLARYLVEECYELLQAIEDRAAGAENDAELREELGDVLLQVLFHARIADDFGIDDVAADLAAKLMRRHPHVFADDDGRVESVATAADQQVRWDELKRTEAGRDRVLAGVATGQPAVALAAKLGVRAAKFGLAVDLPQGDGVGERLYRLAFAAGFRGEDPEAALRAVALAHAGVLAAAQTGDRDAPRAGSGRASAGY